MTQESTNPKPPARRRWWIVMMIPTAGLAALVAGYAVSGWFDQLEVTCGETVCTEQFGPFTARATRENSESGKGRIELFLGKGWISLLERDTHLRKEDATSPFGPVRQ